MTDKLSRKTPEELETLVQDIIGGRVFGTWNIKPGDFDHLVRSIFMPLTFMKMEDAEVLKETAHIYAPMSEAGPRSINGYPCFFSMNLIGQEDWDIVADRVIRIQDKIDALAKGETE